jgi:hypothetical protein
MVLVELPVLDKNKKYFGNKFFSSRKGIKAG